MTDLERRALEAARDALEGASEQWNDTEPPPAGSQAETEAEAYRLVTEALIADQRQRRNL